MASNPHGLDYKYFERKIAIMHRDGLSSWKPDELARELARMSRTADAAVMHEPEFAAVDQAQEDRGSLIAYGRSCGLDEASTLCSRLAYAAYYPPGTRFKAFTPKTQKALGDLLIKAANEIASLPGGPYERFKERQSKKAESAKAR